MSSSFVGHFTRSLFDAASAPPHLTISQNAVATLARARSLPITTRAISETLDELPWSKISGQDAPLVSQSEDDALKVAVVGQLVVRLYAEALDTCLSQATYAEVEAEWWAEVERSWLNVAYYFLQSLPLRSANVVRTVLHSLHERGQTLSQLRLSSVPSLLPSPATAFFPYLISKPLPISLATANLHNSLTRLATLPLALARHECHTKRKALENIRDDLATTLGRLALLRAPLAEALSNPPVPHAQNFAPIISQLLNVMHPTSAKELLYPAHIAVPTLLLHFASASENLAAPRIETNLLRPSRLTLLWPKLVFFPPLALYCLRALYTSRTTLYGVLRDGRETVRAFVSGWLIEPLRDVIHTVRAGNDDGVIIHKEAVTADMDSLERMALSLAKDELKYSPAQLSVLAAQIRLGDMTPVQELYEAEMRKPLFNAVGGSLVRTLLVQVQKAKVDLNIALAGIDHLLKSQELTFAFVGVAPAIALTYVSSVTILGLGRSVGGGLGLWRGERERYGGVCRRQNVWTVMRRIERILITEPSSESSPSLPSPAPALVAPYPTGLLMLSLAQLRNYALEHLPKNSYLQLGFLADLEDLEDPQLGRARRMEVVARMWRSWGSSGILGWSGNEVVY